MAGTPRHPQETAARLVVGLLVAFSAIALLPMASADPLDQVHVIMGEDGVHVFVDPESPVPIPNPSNALPPFVPDPLSNNLGMCFGGNCVEYRSCSGDNGPFIDAEVVPPVYYVSVNGHYSGFRDGGC